MAVSRRDFSHTCTACDNPWQYEDQFGKEFSESCDLSFTIDNANNASTSLRGLL